MRLIMKYLLLSNHRVQCFRSFSHRSFFNKRNLLHNQSNLGFVLSKKYCLHYSTNMSSLEGLNLTTLFQLLTNFAPLSLAESWDNVGLLIKPISSKNIYKVLLTIDLTEGVMQEALDKHVDMIISYHPPIFAPLKKITNKAWKVSFIL